MKKTLIDEQEKITLAAESFPEVSEELIFWGKINLQRADKYKAIVNPKTGKVYSIVSKDYKLIRHEDAIQQIEDVINEFPELGKYKVKTEFYKEGARMRRNYCFKEIFVEIAPRDTVNPELQLYNSYDTSWPLFVLLGAFRLICTNGLVVGNKFLHLRKRHVYDLHQIDLKKQVSTALKRFKLQAEQWMKWVDLQLTEKTYHKVMETIEFGKMATEEIKNRTTQEAEGFDDNNFPIMSLWIFFNVLTWYITHCAVSLNHRVEMERKLRSAMKYFRSPRIA